MKITRKQFQEIVKCDQKEFDALIKSTKEFVGFLLESGTDSVIPQLVVLSRKFNEPGDSSKGLAIFMVMDDFNETKDKRTIMRGIASEVYEKGLAPLAVVFLAEAWISRKVADDGEPLCQPRHDPDREEAIVIAAQALDNPKMRFTDEMIISRDENNNIKEGEWEGGADKAAPLMNHFWMGYLEACEKGLDRKEMFPESSVN